MKKSKRKFFVNIFIVTFLALILGFYVYLEISYSGLTAKIIEDEAPPVVLCNDTDFGLNYFVYGRTDGITLFNPIPNSYSDQCFSLTSLKEYYCQNNYVTELVYSCSLIGKICQEGKCVDASFPPSSMCNDSDGLNYQFKGNVSGKISANSSVEIFPETFPLN